MVPQGHQRRIQPNLHLVLAHLRLLHNLEELGSRLALPQEAQDLPHLEVHQHLLELLNQVVEYLLCLVALDLLQELDLEVRLHLLLLLVPRQLHSHPRWEVTAIAWALAMLWEQVSRQDKDQPLEVGILTLACHSHLLSLMEMMMIIIQLVHLLRNMLILRTKIIALDHRWKTVS